MSSVLYNLSRKEGAKQKSSGVLPPWNFCSCLYLEHSSHKISIDLTFPPLSGVTFLVRLSLILLFLKVVVPSIYFIFSFFSPCFTLFYGSYNFYFPRIFSIWNASSFAQKLQGTAQILVPLGSFPEVPRLSCEHSTWGSHSSS